ncbi:MAG: hypothetical protein PUD31_06920 [Solobacterium sp.]|nr:hypothetical protein [Solobacterium sp.]
MLQTAYYTAEPDKIKFEKHENINRIWLRTNIKKEQDEEGNIQFVCDEAFFESVATKEDILKSFNEYFSYASSWEVSKEPTIEERLSAIEEATLYLVNALGGGE